jgi:5-hydroxyisourate hydrolase
MSAITTHVLDTALGRPAAGIAVTLDAWLEPGWRLVGEGVTDDDGRIHELGPAIASAGRYRLTFHTQEYLGPAAFWPEVTITFAVTAPAEHQHVPLLLSPFAFSTYRGS